MPTSPEHPITAGRRRRIAVTVLLAAAIAGGYFLLRPFLTPEILAARQEDLTERMRNDPWLVWGCAFVTYVVVTGLSLPGATLLTLVCAWIFGFVKALLLVSFASTIGATLAFLSSRYLFREIVQKHFGTRLAAFNRALESDGASYLFTLRLIPAVPFFVINVVMGLTPIRVRTFYWVSQLGMLPGTIVYVYAGAGLPNLQTLADNGIRGILTPRILLAFTALAVLPYLLRHLIGYKPDGE